MLSTKERLKNSARYLAWGLLSNTALRLYFAAPREMLQDEFFNIHRYALKKAHNARMANERDRHNVTDPSAV